MTGLVVMAAVFGGLLGALALLALIVWLLDADITVGEG